MKMLMTIPPGASVLSLLELLSRATEFREIRLRQSERTVSPLLAMLRLSKPLRKIYGKIAQSEELMYPLERKPSSTP